jgi:hypothetical protein
MASGLAMLSSSIADPHHFDADPDPACHFDADPGAHHKMMRIRIPVSKTKAQNLEKVLK